MNARALSQVGSPVLIEDAMAYAELQADNKALRTTNANQLAALKLIVKQCYWIEMFRIAQTAIQQVEGIE